MMPLGVRRIRWPLTSLTISGTSGSMRNAEELSITTAPAFTAMGANRGNAPPAENSAMSTPAGCSVSSSITIRWPRRVRCRPAGAGQRLQPAHAKAAPVHGGDEFGADGTGHAGNGNNRIVLTLVSI
jgi:hypothetical protein